MDSRNGTSEFTITGTLKSWSCLDQIHTITAPTLLTNGVMDEAQDACVSLSSRESRM
ncbi:hypothetical protein EV424DRAFT_1380455 [Suillus variegatus]|nr:hypothetical protein EV424DRAFT_1380455 [Suillus variegatus]